MNSIVINLNGYEITIKGPDYDVCLDYASRLRSKPSSVMEPETLPETGLNEVIGSGALETLAETFLETKGYGDKKNILKLAMPVLSTLSKGGQIGNILSLVKLFKRDKKKDREEIAPEAVSPTPSPSSGDDTETIANIDLLEFFDYHDRETGRKHTLRKWDMKNIAKQPVLNFCNVLTIAENGVMADKNCNFIMWIVKRISNDLNSWVLSMSGGQEGSLGFSQELRWHVKEHHIQGVKPSHLLALKLGDGHKVIGRGRIQKI